MRHERVRKILAGVLCIAIVISLASAALGLRFGREASALTPPPDVSATETSTPPEEAAEETAADTSTITETLPADDTSAGSDENSTATVEATSTENDPVSESETTASIGIPAPAIMMPVWPVARNVASRPRD